MRNKKSDYRAHSKRVEDKKKIKAKSYKSRDSKRNSSKASKKRAQDSVDVCSISGSCVPTDKAYKLLATQEGISNSKAKALIDRGLVQVGNKKVAIARGELPLKSEFKVQKIERAKVIFENSDIVVVDKPAFVNSDELEREFKGARLLHRLDRETSGVLMLAKTEEFRSRAISAFKKLEVYKEYVALVDGVVIEPFIVDKPIVTQKRHNRAHSTTSIHGKPAITEVTPLEVSSKKSKLKCVIQHGRTHQIRTHLRSAGYSIVGDEQYGGCKATRVMLHASRVKILDLEFSSPEPKLFSHLIGN